MTFTVDYDSGSGFFSLMPKLLILIRPFGVALEDFQVLRFLSFIELTTAHFLSY